MALPFRTVRGRRVKTGGYGLNLMHMGHMGRASDLRSPVADRLVMYLINLDVVRPSQFTTEGEKGVRMDDRAVKAYLKNYEKFMTTPFHRCENRGTEKLPAGDPGAC